MYENLYEQVKPIMNSVISKVHFSYPNLDKEELKSEAHEVFMHCVKKNSNNKGKFENFFASSLHWRLYEYAHGGHARSKERKVEFVTIDDLQLSTNSSPILDVTFQSLSRDAKQLTDIIFSPPPALFKALPLKNMENPRISKRLLMKYLRNNLNWKRSRILQSFQEIQNFLKQSQDISYQY